MKSAWNTYNLRRRVWDIPLVQMNRLSEDLWDRLDDKQIHSLEGRLADILWRLQ
jgi:hypothetical protein